MNYKNLEKSKKLELRFSLCVFSNRIEENETRVYVILLQYITTQLPVLLG